LAVILVAPERPPVILQIYREPLKPGRDAVYRAIEEETARVCATLECPHPHLAIESLTGADGARAIFRQAATRDEESLLAEAGGPETTLFAVRPYWGMPATEWIAADPEFWKVNPLAGVKWKRARASMR